VVQAGVDQLAANTVAAAVRVHEQDAQHRVPVVGGHARHAAHADAVQLGDPHLVPHRIQAADDARDQPLEADVPAELAGVELAVGLHDPAQVARPVGGPDRNSHGVLH